VGTVSKFNGREPDMKVSRPAGHTRKREFSDWGNIDTRGGREEGVLVLPRENGKDG